MGFSEAHKTECDKCGRKVVVHIAQIGVSHISSVTITCGDCMGLLHKPWVEANPEQAKELIEWLNSK